MTHWLLAERGGVVDGMDDATVGANRTGRRRIGLVAIGVVVVTVIVFPAIHLGSGTDNRSADARTAVVNPAVILRPEGTSPPSTIAPPSTVGLPSTPSSSTVRAPTRVPSPTLPAPSTPPTGTTTTPTTTEPLDAPTCPSQGLFPGGTSLPNSGPIVPSGAQAAVVCEYSWNAVALHVISTLVRSSSILTGGSLAALIDEVDESGPEYGSVPLTTTTSNPTSTVVGTAPADPAPEYEVYFSYPAGDLVAFGVTPNGPLAQLASSASDTGGELWVPSAGLLTEVSSLFN